MSGDGVDAGVAARTFLVPAASSAATATTAATATAAAATATTTTVATEVAAATTVATTATTTVFAGSRFVDDKIPVLERLAVQRLDGCFALRLRGHLDEREPSRTACKFVRYDVDLLNVAELTEHLAELLLGRLVRKIPDVNPHSKCLLLPILSNSHTRFSAYAALVILPFAPLLRAGRTLLAPLASAHRAPSRLIRKALLRKELLLGRRESEFLATVRASDFLVLETHG
jgi:hypothetical protein